MNLSFSSLRVFALAVVFSISAFAQTQASASSSAASSTYSPSLDVNSMDRSVDPCTDFYKYSCGGWQKRNPIPADQTSWSVYGKLYQDNLQYLRGILEDAAQARQRDAVTQKIGDYYSACMNEAAVNRRGVQAINPELDAIAGLKSVHDLAPLVARFLIEASPAATMFGASSIQDPDNSEQQIAGINQGGIGLPDRDYYTKDDAKSKETRERYLQHVQKIFQLLGDPAAKAQAEAQDIMRIETALAQASLTRVERRDPYKRRNKMKVSDLEALAPNFDWNAFFKATNAPQFETLNVTAPPFFKALNAELASE